jgi:Glycosyltransferases involved in cell wall biogenesis
MKNKEKKVSIIIRTKNEEQWIEMCIRKILEQSYKNIEIIIVDNNSTDKTLQKIIKYKIKTIKIKKFLPGKAINLGIKKSKGEIIVCLSAHCIPVDKFWLKNLVKDLSKKKIAAVYGKQKPLPYSSAFDKRDLYNTFGDEKRIQSKDTFFHNANSAFHKKIWLKNHFDEKNFTLRK